MYSKWRNRYLYLLWEMVRTNHLKQEYVLMLSGFYKSVSEFTSYSLCFYTYTVIGQRLITGWACDMVNRWLVEPFVKAQGERSEGHTTHLHLSLL